MLLCEKYAWKHLSDFTVSKDTIFHLNQLIKSGNIPHLLFIGPNGSLKKTAALCLLNDFFCQELPRKKVNIEIKTAKSKKTIEFITSGFHIELDAIDMGTMDFSIITRAVKKILNIQVLNDIPYRFIIINNANKLTISAQQALRRIMENYAHISRFLLISTSVSGIMKPIRSRCVIIPFKKLYEEELIELISTVIQQEKTILLEKDGINLDKYNKEFIKKLIDISDGDLELALTILQTAIATNLDPAKISDLVPEYISHIRYIYAAIKKFDEKLLDIKTKGFQSNPPEISKGIIRAIYSLIFESNISPSEVLIHIIRHAEKHEQNKKFLLKLKELAASTDYTIKKSYFPHIHLIKFVIDANRIYRSCLS